MLYAIYRGHDDYYGGQDRVGHLVSSVNRAIGTQRPWAFTDRHADLGYAAYFDDLAELARVAWNVMDLGYWAGDEETKSRRQAEFLVHEYFPWSAVEGVVVRTREVATEVEALLGSSAPPIDVRPTWYY